MLFCISSSLFIFPFPSFYILFLFLSFFFPPIFFSPASFPLSSDSLKTLFSTRLDNNRLRRHEVSLVARGKYRVFHYIEGNFLWPEKRTGYWNDLERADIGRVSAPIRGRLIRSTEEERMRPKWFPVDPDFHRDTPLLYPRRSRGIKSPLCVLRGEAFFCLWNTTF